MHTAKGCCFYPVSKDSVVLVGVKCKNRYTIPIPKRIGKYTVRGIDDPFCPGRLNDAYTSLDEKKQHAVRMKLLEYKLLSEVNIGLLPNTVEYIGLSKLYGLSFDEKKVQIPTHICYIHNLELPNLHMFPTPLVIPSSLRYLGAVETRICSGESPSYYSLEFYASNHNTPPCLRLSDYLGREVEEVTQIGEGAFAKFPNLMYMTLPKGITSIGNGAFANTHLYSITLPEGLTHIGSGAFSNCESLNEFNLPDSLTYLAPDAFSNCPRLRLTPSVLKQLERFPDVRETLVQNWEKAVQAYLEAGDKLLLRKNLTMYDKWCAFEQCRQALILDPFCISAIHSLGQLLLTYQLPNEGIIDNIPDLQKLLKEQKSTDALELLNSYVSMLDSVCIILSASDSENIITHRHIYGLNRDQEAAAALLKFLLDTVEKHPKISDFACRKILKVVDLMIERPTRNKDRQSEKSFLAQKQRYQKIFRIEPDFMEPIIDLTSKDFMKQFREAMAKANDAGFYDAELWLELARTFNPNVEIPKEFTKMQSRCRAKEKAEVERWKKRMAAVAFPPEPILPSFHYSSREEDTSQADDLVSEYWAGVAARKEAEAIESLWGDLADIGFWDDTSWQ